MQDALFLDLPHARLEYQFLPAAAPGRPVLVLLHEALGSLAHWKDFPAVLATVSGCASTWSSRYVRRRRRSMTMWTAFSLMTGSPRPSRPNSRRNG